jgi:hypothetical protein
MAQINKPTEHFNTKTYSGNSSTNAITGVGFQPDLVWIKCRSATASNLWQDSVRGKSGSVHYYLESDNNESEKVQTDGDGVSTMDSDGYTITYGNSGAWNQTGRNYVSWNWKANGSTTVSNTDGSITSSVSVNTNAGFSIVSYTGNLTDGATVGHGLGVTPSCIIFKNRSDTQYWVVYHKDLGGANNHLRLDGTAAKRNDLNMFSSTAPTSSVFELGNKEQVNGNTNNIIAYCFAEKKGYSKFGSYVGNNSADGTFVYTGFSPAFVLVRNTSAVAHWMIQDNRRSDANGDNPANKRILPSSNAAEATDSPIDLLSNGFKIRSTGSYTNDSGNNYIYMAFAEQPLVGTNNIPATAR